jgi:hypothetical protein
MMLFLPAFWANYKTTNNIQIEGAPEWFTIEGLVENRLNLTYTELRNFPLISEVTTLQCVGGGQGGISVNYNWTGVPLFYLLSMAKVISGAYREVVFNASDGFSSSVPLEVAMHPTSILALEANGTDLELINGFGGGYRVVLPCRWGYKWVKWIKQIIIVDYDYKGDYERKGLSDDAFRPNCTMPTTDPPFQTFNVTKKSQTYSVQALSNSSIESVSTINSSLILNVAGTEKTSGYIYITFTKELLKGPYQVYIDHNPTEYKITETESKLCLFFSYGHNSHTITIEGIPEIESDSEGGLSRKALVI